MRAEQDEARERMRYAEAEGVKRSREETAKRKANGAANGHSTEPPPEWDDVPPPGDDDAAAGEEQGPEPGGEQCPLVELFDPTTLQGKNVPERRWLVSDWIPADTTSGFYGDGGTGKTLLAQQLQTCCATALKWLAFRPCAAARSASIAKTPRTNSTGGRPTSTVTMAWPSPIWRTCDGRAASASTTC
jgi:hypothetical protein